MDAAEEDRQYEVGLNRLFYVYSRYRINSPDSRVVLKKKHNISRRSSGFSPYVLRNRSKIGRLDRKSVV